MKRVGMEIQNYKKKSEKPETFLIEKNSITLNVPTENCLLYGITGLKRVQKRMFIIIIYHVCLLHDDRKYTSRLENSSSVTGNKC